MIHALGPDDEVGTVGFDLAPDDGVGLGGETAEVDEFALFGDFGEGGAVGLAWRGVSKRPRVCV